jgi:uncharacterized membrane protein
MVTFTPRMGKWLLALLVVSLGINIFLGSMIVGRHFHRPHGEMFAERAVPGADRPLRRIAMRMFSSIPDDQRPILEQAFADQRRNFQTAGQASRDARERLRTVLSTEPFDAAALDRAFADLRARTEEVQKVMHATIASAAVKMSPEGRKRLAEWNPEPERRRGPPGPPPPPPAR